MAQKISSRFYICSDSWFGLTLILAFPHSSACFCLGRWDIGRGQNWLSSWARWWNILDQSQPDPTIRTDGPPCSLQIEIRITSRNSFVPNKESRLHFGLSDRRQLRLSTEGRRAAAVVVEACPGAEALQVTLHDDDDRFGRLRRTGKRTRWQI